MADSTRAERKAELIAEIGQSRIRLQRNFNELRRDADVAAHFKQSYSSHKAAWLSAAGVAGWVLARLPARRKKVKVFVSKKDEEKVRTVAEAGLLIGVLKFLFTLAKPAIVTFASKKLSDLATKNSHLR